MKGVKIYLTDEYLFEKPISFEKVTDYKIKKGFLCMTLVDGKSICYNISRIERFEVDADDDRTDA